MHLFHSLLTRPVSVLVCLVTLAAPFSATVAYAASERIAPPVASTRLPEQATRLGQCPPGQTSYRSGTGGAPKCVLARSCPPGVKLDTVTGQCQCPAGTKVYWDGAGGGGCVP